MCLIRHREKEDVCLSHEKDGANAVDSINNALRLSKLLASGFLRRDEYLYRIGDCFNPPFDFTIYRV